MAEKKISALIDDLAQKKAQQEQLENEISDLQRMVSQRLGELGIELPGPKPSGNGSKSTGGLKKRLSPEMLAQILGDTSVPRDALESQLRERLDPSSHSNIPAGIDRMLAKGSLSEDKGKVSMTKGYSLPKRGRPAATATASKAKAPNGKAARKR